MFIWCDLNTNILNRINHSQNQDKGIFLSSPKLKSIIMTEIKQGHPKGLYLLFATEMWERFSYYGMRAIFILFMTKALFMSAADASNVYGSYTGLVYLTPLLGGYIA